MSLLSPPPCQLDPAGLALVAREAVTPPSLSLSAPLAGGTGLRPLLNFACCTPTSASCVCPGQGSSRVPCYPRFHVQE